MTKRGREEIQPRAESLMLNVGGRPFIVGKSTLAKIRWFEPLLEGRMSSGSDSSGAFFIDRDPDLFSIILQAARINRRPPRRAIDRFGSDLLCEAEYYCMDWLAELLRGSISSAHMPPDVTRLRDEEMRARQYFEGQISEEPCGCLVDLHQYFHSQPPANCK